MCLPNVQRDWHRSLGLSLYIGEEGFGVGLHILEYLELLLPSEFVICSQLQPIVQVG